MRNKYVIVLRRKRIWGNPELGVGQRLYENNNLTTEAWRAWRDMEKKMGMALPEKEIYFHLKVIFGSSLGCASCLFTFSPLSSFSAFARYIQRQTMVKA